MEGPWRRILYGLRRHVITRIRVLFRRRFTRVRVILIRTFTRVRVVARGPMYMSTCSHTLAVLWCASCKHTRVPALPGGVDSDLVGIAINVANHALSVHAFTCIVDLLWRHATQPRRPVSKPWGRAAMVVHDCPYI